MKESKEKFKRIFLALYLNKNRASIAVCHRLAVEKCGYLMSFNSVKYMVNKLKKTNPELIQSARG